MNLRQPVPRLDDNLQQHLVCTQALIDLLVEEKTALLGQDVDSLARVCAAKAEAAASLQALSTALHKLCGCSDAAGIEARLRQQPASLTLWQQLLQLAARCQQANLENGALLLERQVRVRSMLQLMQQGERPVYRRSGTAGTEGTRRALALA